MIEVRMSIDVDGHHTVEFTADGMAEWAYASTEELEQAAENIAAALVHLA
jgi:hypothetical protein